MKKIIKVGIFFIFIIILIRYSNEIIESINISFNLCIKKLFPTLIPFMLLSNILINYNLIYDLSDLLKPITKIFKVNKNCSFALIMSMISGTPSNAKYLYDLNKNKLINDTDLKNCLNFIHYTNPIFVLQTIGTTYLFNKKLGLIILISHYISSFIIGIFNKKSIILENKNINNFNNKSNNFFNILIKSIKSTIDVLLLICGIITVFLMFTSIINIFLKINNNYKFIYGIIEITQGLHYLSTSNINIILKTCIASFFISFGGFCIHLQVFSILDNKKIKYKPYFISRIIHGILSFIFTLILIMMFY